MAFDIAAQAVGAGMFLIGGLLMVFTAKPNAWMTQGHAERHGQRPLPAFVLVWTYRIVGGLMCVGALVAIAQIVLLGRCGFC